MVTVSATLARRSEFCGQCRNCAQFHRSARRNQPRAAWVGDSYDNALAESIIGRYKAEVIRHQGPWRGLEAVAFATLEWVDWFNNRRILEPIGNRPPAEAEAAYDRQTEHTALAA